MALEPKDFEHLVKQILAYRGDEKTPYIKKYDKSWLLQIIEETDQIQKIEAGFDHYDPQGIDLIDFTRVLLNIIPHEENETLYLTIALIDLFKDICETFNLKNLVKSQDVLNYIVEDFLNKNPNGHVIPTRRMPEKKKFGEKPWAVREIDINAPVVFGNVAGGIKRLKNKVFADRTHHNSHIKRACFGEEVKKIFTLDPLGDHISVYDLNCILDRKIYPRNLNEKGDIMVLDFAWSNKQQRIGAVLKDFTMSFWDANDNYGFEKKFSVANYTTDYQTHIWYLEFIDLWITSDKTHVIHIWDIEKEVKTATISSPKIKSNIISVVPIDVLKLVAVASLDKIITIWDFKRKIVVVELDVSQGGVHSMVWSASYQILITAGYENNINLWEINPRYLDVTSKGKLIGHSSMVTAVEAIDKTPMIVSADDQGNIKVWDIRNLNCVQTLALGIKSTINLLIDNYKYGKLCFVGMRVNVIEFDETADPLNKIKSEEQLWPIYTEYNFDMNEVVVCTRKDIRFIDMETGRCKKVYTGLFTNEEDEIASFRLVQQNKKFILGSYRGQVNLYLYATGELIKCLQHHSNEVMTIKVDYANNLIVTSSWDSWVFIQKENNTSSEIKRSMKNLHFNKEITHMELSVYHNLIVTTTSNNVLYVWDYEYGKLIGSIEIEEGCEPTFILFMNGYSILIIGDNSGKINFLHFQRRDTNYISFRRIAYIDVATESDSSDTGSQPLFANKAVVQINHEGKGDGGDSSKLYFSTNKGVVNVYRLDDLLKIMDIKLIPHACTRSNYNADRITNEDFLHAIKNYKICVYDINADNEETNEGKSQSALLLNDYLVKKFKTHKDALTNLALVVAPVRKLLTSSLDCYVKLWTVKGVLLASININHPLPIKWGLQHEGEETYQKKILYALKVIETIFKRYKGSIFVPEAKKVSINRFIKKFQTPGVLGKIGYVNSARVDYEPQLQEKKVVLTMGDEYSPRDLQFNNAKVIFQKELQGPSLRQMEISKRLIEAQKMWKDHNKATDIDGREEAIPLKTGDEQKDRNEFMNLLMGDTRKDLVKETHMSKATKMLAKKLDSISLRKPRPSQKIYSNNKRRESFTFVTNVVQKGNLLTSPLVNLYSQTNLSETSEGVPRSPQLAPVSRTNVTPKDHNEKPKQKEKVEKTDKIMMPNLTLHVPPLSPTKLIKETSISDYTQSHRSKSLAKVDFLEYAKEKLSPDTKWLNTQCGDEESMVSPKKAMAYQRRVKKKNFNQVLSRLDDNLRKSQLPGQGWKHTSISGAFSHRQNPVSISPLQPQTEKHSDKLTSPSISFAPEHKIFSTEIGSRTVFHGRNNSLPAMEEKHQTFMKDLGMAKKWIEDNWGMKVDNHGVGPVNTTSSGHSATLYVPKKLNGRHFSEKKEKPINNDPYLSLAGVFEKERSSFRLPSDSALSIKHLGAIKFSRGEIP